MDDAAKKNFAIIQSTMNAQAKIIRDLTDRLSLAEGNIATLRAEIQNTKQMTAHLHGRGMGSTVHN